MLDKNDGLVIISSQAGNSEQTQVEMKALIEKWLDSKQIVVILWGDTIINTQKEELEEVIDSIILEKKEAEKLKTLTGLILGKSLRIAQILDLKSSEQEYAP